MREFYIIETQKRDEDFKEQFLQIKKNMSRMFYIVSSSSWEKGMPLKSKEMRA